MEAARYDPDSLNGVAARTDALGQLARVFQRMAQEVHAREERLQQQVRELRIEIDEARQAKRVAEITESEHYQALRRQAAALRRIMEGPS
jgi:DNA repair ATPase RecN